MKHKSVLRRTILGTLAAAALAAPPVASGCSAGFAPISQVDALRVLAVVADKPYANPGDTVNFTLTYEDGLDPAHPRPVQILWLGGCFNPPGGDYYGCYPLLLGGSTASDAGTPTQCQSAPIPGLSSTTFSLKLPETLLDPECAPPTPGAPTYATAFVFFAVCAGTVGLPDGGASTATSSGGAAGNFPLQCLDANGNPLDAKSFVPGYTQVYAFAPIDGQPVTNTNPVVNGLLLSPSDGDGDGGSDAGVPDGGSVTACDVTEADRAASGCAKKDPSRSCAQYDVTVDVPDDVAEVDPTTKDTTGTALHETVWVDYYADWGDIDTPVLLVSDAQTGIQPRDKLTTKWTPPAPATDADGGKVPLTATLWAVVHDSRGGEQVVSRTVTVE